MIKSNSKDSINRNYKIQNKCDDFYLQGNQYKKILNSGSQVSDCEFDSCLSNFSEDPFINT